MVEDNLKHNVIKEQTSNLFHFTLSLIDCFILIITKKKKKKKKKKLIYYIII